MPAACWVTPSHSSSTTADPQAYVIRLASPAITTGTGKNQVPSGSGTATPGAVAIAVTGGQITFTAKESGSLVQFLWNPNRQPRNGRSRHIRCLGGLRAKQRPPDHAGEFQRQDSGERRIDRFEPSNRCDHRPSHRGTGRRNLHAERGNGRQRNLLRRSQRPGRHGRLCDHLQPRQHDRWVRFYRPESRRVGKSDGDRSVQTRAPIPPRPTSA